jgi:excisionase family DNA binding protein
MSATLSFTPKVYSVEQTARLLGLSRNATYEAIRKNKLPHIRVGGRILIPIAKLNQMLGEEPLDAA